MMSIPMQVDLVSRLPSLSLSPTPQRGLTSFDHDLMPVRLGASLHTFSEPLSSSTGQLCFNFFLVYDYLTSVVVLRKPTLRFFQ